MRIALSATLRAFLAVATLAVVGLVAPAAAAKCMMPHPELAPGLGVVPTNPVLRLFVPARAANPPLPRVVARLAGKQVPVIVTADTQASDLRTYRVAVTAAIAGSLEVDLLDLAGTVLRRWTLTVDPRWQPPVASGADITVTREATRWTCSHQLTRNLRFTGSAAAYRVVFVDTVDKPSVVLPADPEDYFRTRQHPPLEVDLALGHVNCFGNTLEWTHDKLATVHALMPDGSEQPVTRAPVVVAPP